MVALKARAYSGVLALEPHLKRAEHSFGFSGPDGMTTAANALRALMAAAATSGVMSVRAPRTLTSRRRQAPQ